MLLFYILFPYIPFRVHSTSTFFYGKYKHLTSIMIDISFISVGNKLLLQQYPACVYARNKTMMLWNYHRTKKPVTTMLTYPWKCTVLHCNHLGNTWKPLVLMTRHFDYCPSASEGVISTSGFQVFPRWLQCKTVHFQG